jgi:hypothetical protein
MLDNNDLKKFSERLTKEQIEKAKEWCPVIPEEKLKRITEQTVAGNIFMLLLDKDLAKAEKAVKHALENFRNITPKNKEKMITEHFKIYCACTHDLFDEWWKTKNLEDLVFEAYVSLDQKEKNLLVSKILGRVKEKVKEQMSEGFFDDAFKVCWDLVKTFQKQLFTIYNQPLDKNKSKKERILDKKGHKGVGEVLGHLKDFFAMQPDRELTKDEKLWFLNFCYENFIPTIATIFGGEDDSLGQRRDLIEKLMQTQNLFRKGLPFSGQE